MAIAVRRCCSWVLVMKFEIIPLSDVGLKSATCWEVDAASALAAAMKAFHTSADATAAGQPISVASHAFFSDGTSSTVWRNSGPISLVLESCHTMNPECVEDGASFHETTMRRQAIPSRTAKRAWYAGAVLVAAALPLVMSSRHGYAANTSEELWAVLWRNRACHIRESVPY